LKRQVACRTRWSRPPQPQRTRKSRVPQWLRCSGACGAVQALLQQERWGCWGSDNHNHRKPIALGQLPVHILRTPFRSSRSSGATRARLRRLSSDSLPATRFLISRVRVLSGLLRENPPKVVDCLLLLFGSDK
jgi:hypothetical protein